jgi:hypothetical protein
MSKNNAEVMFTEKEVLSIREGIDGVKHVIPPRFYTDEAIYKHKECFVGIYPAGPMMYVNNYQCTYIQTHHEEVDSNHGNTGQAYAPWAIDSPGGEEKVGFFTQMMKDIQDEDTYGCTMLQKGLKAGNDSHGLLQPLEVQLNHYHNWYLDQMLNK